MTKWEINLSMFPNPGMYLITQSACKVQATARMDYNIQKIEDQIFPPAVDEDADATAFDIKNTNRTKKK